MASEPVSGATVRPGATRLALERTRLAYERTLMAWIRTAVSLIGFGFSIYKFFQYVRANEQGEPVRRLLGPLAYGILMISMGLFALLLATVQHRRSMKLLREEYPEAPVSLAAVLAATISTLGIVALAAAIFRQ